MRTKFQILPTSPATQDLETEREFGLSHSSFKEELLLFNLIKNGKVSELKNKMTEYFSKEIIMGRMTGNSERQIKYWAVSTIAVAVHYAILGGLDETDAFNESDKVIRKIDSIHNFNDPNESQEIFSILQEEAVNLTKKVYSAKEKQGKSKIVKDALHYIHLNLKERITVSDLAQYCSVSTGYIAKKFKKETGYKINDYILKEKLESAKLYLSQGKSIEEVAFELSFCTESYFIECFKNQYGVTPKKFTNSFTDDSGVDAPAVTPTESLESWLQSSALSTTLRALYTI